MSPEGLSICWQCPMSFPWHIVDARWSVRFCQVVCPTVSSSEPARWQGLRGSGLSRGPQSASTSFLHGFQQPDPDALPEQLPGKIRSFFFFALQVGLSEFSVVQGGWLVLVLMPSCWCMRPTSHQPVLTTRGTLPMKLGLGFARVAFDSFPVRGLGRAGLGRRHGWSWGWGR
jgi:hypothetical protein